MANGMAYNGLAEHSGLSQSLIDAVADAGARGGAQKIVLFGSRARGDHRERSDIDLAVYGMDAIEFSRFASELDEYPTLMRFDIVRVSKDLDAEFLRDIEKDGVAVMEKKNTKLENFTNAISRTKEGLEEYGKNPSRLSRDGIIQRFEFTAELAWKSCREYLMEQGYVGVDSPMSVMKTAFSAGIVNSEQGWVDLLKSRNLTSHMYSDSQADAIFEDITQRFIPLLESLRDRLNAH